jgi:hypothetical protein
MIMVSMVGAGYSQNIRINRTRTSDLAVDDADLAIQSETFHPSKSPLVNFLPLGIHMPKPGQVLQIFILGSILGLSWVMARKGDMEF